MTRFRLIALLGICASAWVDAQQPAPPSKDPALAVSVPTYQNPNCPIMGKPTSTKLFIDTPKGRIYTCCVPCNRKIRQDPDTAHKAAYPKITKLENKVCPITGNKIEAGAPTVVLQGYEFSVCCKDCIPLAQESSQIVLTKLLHPNVRDVRNTTCPVTGKPVDNNTFVLIGDDLVHLCAAKCCVEEVQKAPAEMLRRAKESAPKEPRPVEGVESKKVGGSRAGN